MRLSSLQYTDLKNSIEYILGDNSLQSQSVQLRTEINKSSLSYIAIEKLQYDNALNTSVKKTLLRANPLFPNSLQSTEVLVSLHGSVHRQSTSPYRPPLQVQSLSYALQPPELHYRLLEPLPAYLGSSLYRAGKQAIVIVNNVSTIDTYDTTVARDLQLCLNHKLLKSNLSHSVPIPHFLDKQDAQHISTINRRRGNVLLECYQLNHLYHRINVIGKAGIVLSDSPGIIIDAIRSAVPAAFIGSPPSDLQGIQDSIIRFLHHENHQLLMQEQQQALHRLLNEARLQCHIVSTQCALQDLIWSAISQQHLSPNHSPEEHCPSSENTDLTRLVKPPSPLILNSQHELHSTERKSHSLKSSIETTRRKLQKFKESPSRFMEDSQSTILRTLTSVRNKT